MTARERLLSYGLQHDTSVEIQKFIESAILDHAEGVREACAKIASVMPLGAVYPGEVCEGIAAAIRAMTVE